MSSKKSRHGMTSLWAVLVIAAVLLVQVDPPADAAEPASPINIGSRLELLLDDYLIESMQNLSFRLHPPRPVERVFRFEKPWEGLSCDYITVFQDGDLFRMYYASHLGAPKTWGGENQVTCYAESKDGIVWTRPSLGLVEFKGSKENNIILWGGNCSHNFTPFIDTRPGVPAEERYKAVGGGAVPAPSVFVSADAIHWKKIRPEPLPIEGAYDSQNVIFWDAVQNEYDFYFRTWDGIRRISHSTSPDFLNWTEAKRIGLGNSPDEHLYTNATAPYFRAPHLYLAFPMRFLNSPQPLVPVGGVPGVCDAVFMFSRDGVNFSRRYMQAYIRPGPNKRNWTKHSIMPAVGLLHTADDELSIYYTQHALTDSNHLRRGVIRLDGFVSVEAPHEGGTFTTKPLIFSGDHLEINADTSAVGGIRCEIQDASGKPLDGFRGQDCVVFYGDEIAHTVHWKGGGDLSDLAGKPVRLCFQMADSDLYSIWFR